MTIEIHTKIFLFSKLANFFNRISPNDFDTGSIDGASGPPYNTFFSFVLIVVASYNFCDSANKEEKEIRN